jgi:hypothetical protein
MMMKLKGSMGGLAVWVCIFVVAATAASSEGDFAMVVNVGNEVSIISRTEAELMFLGKKRSWTGGKAISVIINENPKIYDSFSHTVLRRSPRQFLIFRKKMLFRGQGMPPPTVKTDEEVIEFISTHVGGIGYVSPEAVPLTVKIIQISL